jgi:UDP-N-acetylglucosamine 2-epimerase (non-hydrolysing)
MLKKIISVVGARPNFMKVAPLHRGFKKYESKIVHQICHTGQHYDENMSKIFFEDLELPKPDYYLGVGSGTHAAQTAAIMVEFEKIIIDQKPDLVIVVGDVNSTVACSLTASKLHIKTAHVEAGLRSFDRNMPEEINRILTDNIADYLFVTEQSGMTNLENEGIPAEKVFLTGNVMIDSLKYYLNKTDENRILDNLSISKNEYVLVTLHRPTNVDNTDQAKDLVRLLNNVAKKRRLVFPLHPRTRKNWENLKLLENLNSNIILLDPLGYLDFLTLTKNAELVITDSGGIQEETTYLKVPCITLRDTTERPVTVDIGTNQIFGHDLKLAEEAAFNVLKGKIKKGEIPELWDGKAAERITEILSSKLK